MTVVIVTFLAIESSQAAQDATESIAQGKVSHEESTQDHGKMVSPSPQPNPTSAPEPVRRSSSAPTADQSTDALSFDFIRNPPGKLISVGAHRLHIHCIGSGNTTVVLESGLGGTSLEWEPLQQAIAKRTRTCSYDRGGYGWSDPARDPRDAQTLAHELYLLLNNLNIRGPVLLVSHSFGGFVARALANRLSHRLVGLVLLDTSHEGQFDAFEALSGKALMPTGASFVISPIRVPAGLPSIVRRKMQAFGRMRKTYSAVYGEMKFFRDSALQAKAQRRPFDAPVVVISRGLAVNGDDDKGKRKDQVWHELQADLTTLSKEQGSMEVATHSGHHIHVDQPLMVINTINSLLDQVE